VASTPARFSIVPRAERTLLQFARNGELLTQVEMPGDRADWLSPTVERLTQLLDLPENWDSYGGRPIDPAEVAWALDLLARVMSPGSPPPTVIPTSRGSIELEWHQNGIDLEAHATSKGGTYVYFEDQQSGEAWERELNGDFSPLSAALAELARLA
jgi:hypothetical protein